MMSCVILYWVKLVLFSDFKNGSFYSILTYIRTYILHSKISSILYTKIHAILSTEALVSSYVSWPAPPIPKSWLRHCTQLFSHIISNFNQIQTLRWTKRSHSLRHDQLCFNPFWFRCPLLFISDFCSRCPVIDKGDKWSTESQQKSVFQLVLFI